MQFLSHQIQIKLLQLSLSIPWKHIGRAEVKFCCKGWRNVLNLMPKTLHSLFRTGSHSTEGCVGLRAGLKVLEMRKITAPAVNQNVSHWTCSIVSKWLRFSGTFCMQNRTFYRPKPTSDVMKQVKVSSYQSHPFPWSKLQLQVVTVGQATETKHRYLYLHSNKTLTAWSSDGWFLLRQGSTSANVTKSVQF